MSGTRQAERDFPIDHPGACDYDGTPPKESHFGPGFDFPDDHPARAGQGQPRDAYPGSTRSHAEHAAHDARQLEFSRQSAAARKAGDTGKLARIARAAAEERAAWDKPKAAAPSQGE